jgi:diguanylate cyclase (GGDEF)-like protein
VVLDVAGAPVDDNLTISALIHPAAAATSWSTRGSKLDARQRRAVIDALKLRIAGAPSMLEIDLDLGEIDALRYAIRDHVDDVVPVALQPAAQLRASIAIDAIVAEAATRRVAALEATALVDPLTGFGNRRAAARSFEAALAHGARHGTTVAVAMVDIVGLKAINDEHGHAAGDAALVTFADSLRRAMRADDAAFRFGGDEFVVLAPGSTAVELARLFERVRNTAPTFTAGLAESPVDGTTEAALIAAADERMYARRHGGAAESPAATRPRRRVALLSALTLAVLALGGPVLALTRQHGDVADSRGAHAVATTTTEPSPTSAPPTLGAVTPLAGGGTVGAAAMADVWPASTVVTRRAPSAPTRSTTTTTESPRSTITRANSTTTTTDSPVVAAGARRHGKPSARKPTKASVRGKR